MGRFPRVMPANAGIQDTTTLTEFRLVATPARRKPASPRPVPLDTRFRGYDKAGFPERCALCFLLAKRSNRGAAHRWPLGCFVATAPRNDGWGAADPIDSVVIGRLLSSACRGKGDR
jgi:hypothetical protein